ncbi:DUF4214 domain-containing protein [Aquihabitans sp. McL0605]|uniref:DUF4214 domain-containing protein n=1 Tax=Aquihabitans sp. McL0605 TaxID=3415671 RepID=UPI003CFB1CDD
MDNAYRRRPALAPGLVALAGLLGLTTMAPAASARPATASASSGVVHHAGGLSYLREVSTPATGHVAPRPTPSTRVSAVKSTFVVSYTGFTPEAKAAFQRAVDLWSVLVQSSQPIRIKATYKGLPQGILGGAGPGDFVRDFPGAPRTGTWYPIALANARAGTDLSSYSDIEAEFQSSPGAGWYFGTDGNVPANKTDFTTVVLHEIGHGLGLVDSTDVTSGLGTWGSGTKYPFVYDRFVRTHGGTTITNMASDTYSLGLALQSDGLQWGGPWGTAANGGTLLRLYSPNPFERGSSVAHLDEDVYPTGTANALMTPYLDDGEALHDPGDLALGMLHDLGWTTAGAKGVPGPPTVKAVIGGDQKVIVSWNQPVDTGRQFITGYRAYRYDDGSSTPSASIDLGSAVTSTTFGSLADGTSYRFAVAARNASGYGAPSALSAAVIPVALAPFSRVDTLVRQQFLDFHGREPSPAEALQWLAALQSGAKTPAATVAGIAGLAGSADVSGRATRLYSASFDRLPDETGYRYWLGRLRSGTTLKKASDTFAASTEFKRKYGSLSSTAFVDLVYRNVLHRDADAAGRAYWVAKLDKGAVSRGQVVLNFSESSENVTKMRSEVGSVLLRSAMLDRMPTADEHAADVALLDGGGTLADLAADLMATPAYDARVP